MFPFYAHKGQYPPFLLGKLNSTFNYYWGWSNSTLGRPLTLHLADLGLIPSIPGEQTQKIGI